MSIIAPVPYHRYINLVKADNVQDALLKNSRLFETFLQRVPAGKIDFSYAPGKWTIKQVLQHITDAERVFSYRALWFARKDAQPLPGFEEDNWASTALVTRRNWNDMTAEFYHLRRTTELLFASFDEEAMQASGISNNTPVNVTALGYVCAGHVQHHIQVINERYLNI